MFTKVCVLGDFEIEISSIERTNRVFFFFFGRGSLRRALFHSPQVSLKNSNGLSSGVENLKTLFFSQYSSLRVMEGKIVWKCSEGKQKLLRVSGSFELSRVRVTEGKITVNVRRKSRGNRFWFEFAQDSS